MRHLIMQPLSKPILRQELMPARIRNYRSIIGFNAALMLLGAGGIITPAMSALLHNSSTVVIALSSMRNYLPEND